MKESSIIANEIISLTKEWESKLETLSEDILTQRRNSQNRTIKQILGHLADSASNNIHRVVHLQYQTSPFYFPNYASLGNNDRWIAIQNYQNEDWNSLIQLWKYSMLHLCHVIQNIDDEKLNNEWVSSPDKNFTLSEMIHAFLPHMKLHLQEISELINM